MTKWAPQTGRGIWGTGEVENMINSVKTAYLDGDSHLVIACVSDGAGGFDSARLNSKFSAMYGTWTIRAQVPVALRRVARPVVHGQQGTVARQR